MAAPAAYIPTRDMARRVASLQGTPRFRASFAESRICCPRTTVRGGRALTCRCLRRDSSHLCGCAAGPRNKVDFVIRRLRSVPVPQPPTSSASGSHKRRMDDDRDDSMHPPRSLARGDAVDVYTARMQQQNVSLPI